MLREILLFVLAAVVTVVILSLLRVATGPEAPGPGATRRPTSVHDDPPDPRHRARSFLEALESYRRDGRPDLGFTNHSSALKDHADLVHGHRLENEAVLPLRQALRAAPRDAGVHQRLADVLRGLGRAADAGMHFERAARLDARGRRENVLSALQCYLEVGRPDLAFGLAKDMWSRLPDATAGEETVSRDGESAIPGSPEGDNASPGSAMGGSYGIDVIPANLVSAKQAVDLLEPLVAGGAANADLHFTLANMLYQLGRQADAGSQLLQAARADPGRYFGENLAAARFLLHGGRPDLAVAPALDAARDDPGLVQRWYLKVALDQSGGSQDGIPVALRFDRPPTDPAPPGMAFRDAAPGLGLDRMLLGRGTAMEDIDGDGRYDLVIAALGAPVTFFRNTSPPGSALSFEDATVAWGMGSQTVDPWGVHLVDFDGDGDLDLFCPDPQSEYRLYRWDSAGPGQGNFVDVTAGSGLSGGGGWCGAWLDYDLDGDLDLFMPSMNWDFGRQRCTLFRNDGGGSFREVAADAGVDLYERVFSAAAGDYDKDGDPDLFLNGYEFANHMLRNNGDGTFADVSEDLGVGLPGEGFTSFFADFDNDGWLDIFAAGHQDDLDKVLTAWERRDFPEFYSPRLYLNRRDGGFLDVTREAGIFHANGTMGAGVGDLDGDGWLDVYLGNGGPAMDRLEPNQLYRSQGKDEQGRLRFADIAPALKMDHLGKGHGVAMGDLDRDGDLDILHGIGGARWFDRWPTALYLNESTAEYHWLTVHLRGHGPNTMAVGAKVEVHAVGSLQFREVTAGVGFGGTDTYALEFGLGPREHVDRIDVVWPDGARTSVARPPVDSEITIRQDQGWAPGPPVRHSPREAK